MHGKMLLISILVDQELLQQSLITSLYMFSEAEIVFKPLKILQQVFKKLRFTLEKWTYGRYCSWKIPSQFLTWVFQTRFLKPKFLFLEANIKQQRSNNELTISLKTVSFLTPKNLQLKKVLPYKAQQVLQVKWFQVEIIYTQSVVMIMSIDFQSWTSPGHPETDYQRIGSNPIQSGRKALLIN